MKLFVFLICALLGYVGASSFSLGPGSGNGGLDTAKSRAVAALLDLTGKGARSAAWDIPMPEDGESRKKSLIALGGSISLDVFINEWEAARDKWTPDQQANILDAAMPRLQRCRPELGLARLCALLGNIPLHRTPESIYDAPKANFEAIFRAGPPGKLASDAGKKLSHQLLENYTMTCPVEAAAWLRQHWESGGRDYLRECANAGWAFRLGFEAIEPFLKDGSITDLKNLSFARMTEEPDPAGRMRAIADIQDPKTRAALVKMVGQALPYYPPAKAKEYLAHLPAGQLREDVEKAVLISIGRNRPEEIASWLADSSLNQESVGEVMKAAIKGGFATAGRIPELTALAMGYPDPAAGGAGITEALVKSAARASLAVEFVQALPEGGVRSSAESVLATSLPARDPAAASRWADGLPAGSRLRDEAAANLALSLRGDPEAARAWAESITNEAKRGTVLSELEKKGGGR